MKYKVNIICIRGGVREKKGHKIFKSFLRLALVTPIQHYHIYYMVKGLSSRINNYYTAHTNMYNMPIGIPCTIIYTIALKRTSYAQLLL